jgi:hypothetical protein
LSGSYCTHRVFYRGNDHLVDARHHRVPLGNVSLNYLQYGAEVEIDPVKHLISKVTLSHSSGNITRIQLEEIHLAPKLEDTLFRFTPDSNTEKIVE